MLTIWDTHFWHLLDKGLPLGFGELGGRYAGKDKIWQEMTGEHP